MLFDYMALGILLIGLTLETAALRNVGGMV